MALDEKTLEVCAGDLISILLAFREKDIFSGSKKGVHTAIHKLAEENPEINILFDTNGNYPYSEDLAAIIDRLKLSSILERSLSETDYRIKVSPASFKEALHRKFGEKYFELEEMFRSWAEKFYERVLLRTPSISQAS